MASNTPRPSRAERGAEARAQAQQMRAAQEAAEKRKSLLIKLGVVVAVIAVIALVAAIIFQNNRGEVAASGPAPQGGNANGGIVLVSDTELADTPATTVDSSTLGERPTEQAPPSPRGVEAAPKGEPAQVVIYVDVNCVHCADFETRYADQLQTWVGAGDITLEYRNVAFLDSGSPTNFSSRGANALACVADAAPEAYLPFTKAVFAHYPEGEMSNDELKAMARDQGAEVDSCIDDGTFRPFAQFTNEAAYHDSIPGTPSVWVQGQEWNGQTNPDFAAWAQELVEANK